MHLAVSIDNSLSGIMMHPGCAQVVVHGWFLKFLFGPISGKLQVTDPGFSKLLCPDFLNPNSILNIDFIQAPVNFYLRLTEAIPFLAQDDSIVGIGYLLNLVKDFKLGETAFFQG
jgi:hypothetical protein